METKAIPRRIALTGFATTSPPHPPAALESLVFCMSLAVFWILFAHCFSVAAFAQHGGIPLLLTPTDSTQPGVFLSIDLDRESPTLPAEIIIYRDTQYLEVRVSTLPDISIANVSTHHAETLRLLISGAPGQFATRHYVQITVTSDAPYSSVISVIDQVALAAADLGRPLRLSYIPDFEYPPRPLSF